MTKLTKSDEGFTLIELLIVIAIVAILVSIAALNVTNIADASSLTSLQTETRLVQLAIDQYNMWDVTVSGNPAIPAQPLHTQASINTGTFGKYLSTPTHYFYTWGSGGTDVHGDFTPGPQ